jgi:hypothetical protein
MILACRIRNDPRAAEWLWPRRRPCPRRRTPKTGQSIRSREKRQEVDALLKKLEGNFPYIHKGLNDL